MRTASRRAGGDCALEGATARTYSLTRPSRHLCAHLHLPVLPPLQLPWSSSPTYVPPDQIGPPPRHQDTRTCLHDGDTTRSAQPDKGSVAAAFRHIRAPHRSDRETA